MGGRSSKLQHGAGEQHDQQADVLRKTDTLNRHAVGSNRQSSSSLSPSSCLSFLGNDLLVEIFLYVGNGPFEGELSSAAASSGFHGHNTCNNGANRPSAERGACHEQLMRRSGGCHNVHTPPTPPCLTHTLPHVSKQFRHLCDTSDMLWSAALHRMLKSDPLGWEERVLAIIDGRHCCCCTSTSCRTGSNKRGNGSSFGDINLSPPWALGGKDSPMWKFRVRFKGRPLHLLGEEDLKHYVDLLCQVVGHRHKHCELSDREPSRAENTSILLSSNEISDAKRAVMHLARSRKFRTLPLLHQPTRSVRIGQMLRLDIFDARCGPAISAITAKQTKRELRRGSSLAAPRPEFVLASREAEPVEGTTAILVELLSCNLRTGRRADLVVMPMERVRVVELQERDDEDGVVDAIFRLDPRR